MADTASNGLSCFLLGYGGANNIGADARLLAAVMDVRAAFGPSTTITVGTLDPARTRRILPPAPDLRIAGLPYVFPLAVLRLVARHDVTVLVEGSTFKDSWSPSLLHAFLWAAWCARLSGRRCVAYAVDVGELRPLNRWLTRRVCQRLDLLITRSAAAKRRLIDLGVCRDIRANTDLAFRLVVDPPHRAVPDGHGAVGIAPIEFYQWPIRARFLGRPGDLHRWPYYRTWTRERQAASARMAALYQELIRRCIDRHDRDVVLIAMDELDLPMCTTIAGGLGSRHAARVRRVASTELTPFEMVPLLRSLAYLVTSRYHAAVLSMAAAVPQMAIAHDERLCGLYEELGLEDFLLGYREPRLRDAAIATLDRMIEQADGLRKILVDRHANWFLPASQRNCEDLRRWRLSQTR